VSKFIFLVEILLQSLFHQCPLIFFSPCVAADLFVVLFPLASHREVTVPNVVGTAEPALCWPGRCRLIRGKLHFQT